MSTYAFVFYPPPPLFVEEVLHYPALHGSSSVFLGTSRGRQGAQALLNADIAYLGVDEPQRAETDSDEETCKLRFQGTLAMRAIIGLPSCVRLRTQYAVIMATIVSLFSFFAGIVDILLFAPTVSRSGHHQCGITMVSFSTRRPPSPPRLLDALAQFAVRCMRVSASMLHIEH